MPELTGSVVVSLAESVTDKNFVTDVEKTVLGNTSGTNTGNETAASVRALGFFDTTNDGAGSGLDADLLDGNQASAFATSSHNHSGTYEPADPLLSSIAGLTTAADRMIYTTAADVAAVAPLTSLARNLLDDADQATMRGTLGVDPAGTDNSTPVTVVGTPDYISLSGQELTLGQIDLTADVTGLLPQSNISITELDSTVVSATRDITTADWGKRLKVTTGTITVPSTITAAAGSTNPILWVSNETGADMDLNTGTGTIQGGASTTLADGVSCALEFVSTGVVELIGGAATVGSSPLTTKGDIYTYDTGDARLAVGANGTVLTADSTEPTGVKWATPTGGMSNLVDDTTPDLGGDLNVKTFDIVSDTNTDIDIIPAGTGQVKLGNFVFDVDQTVGAGQDNYVLTYDHNNTQISLEAAGAGSGEANTASNNGTNGVGVYDTQVGVDLQFRHIASVDDDHLTVTLDATDNDIDLVVAAAPKFVFSAESVSGTINPGDVVYIQQETGGVIEVGLADADAGFTAAGIAQDTITTSAAGKVVSFGPVTATTTGETAGAAVYLDTTAGGWTTTRPTAAGVAVQKLGIVTKVGASGEIFVLGAGRSNDIPNRMSDAIVRIHDDGDNSKLIQFQASGITTATTRTITMADQDISLVPGTDFLGKSGTPANNQVAVFTGDGIAEGDAALTFDTTADRLAIGASGKLSFGAVDILSDAAGTTTLSNIDAIDATTETALEAALDHDQLNGFVGNEHIDWTQDQGATNVNDANIAESSVTQHADAVVATAARTKSTKSSGDYAIVAGDVGKIIELTSTATISFDTGVTGIVGKIIWVRNMKGSDTTIAGTATITGDATLADKRTVGVFCSSNDNYDIL